MRATDRQFAWPAIFMVYLALSLGLATTSFAYGQSSIEDVQSDGRGECWVYPEERYGVFNHPTEGPFVVEIETHFDEETSSKLRTRGAPLELSLRWLAAPDEGEAGNVIWLLEEVPALLTVSYDGLVMIRAEVAIDKEQIKRLEGGKIVYVHRSQRRSFYNVDTREFKLEIVLEDYRAQSNKNRRRRSMDWCITVRLIKSHPESELSAVTHGWFSASCQMNSVSEL